jgi:hypothetical protein
MNPTLTDSALASPLEANVSARTATLSLKGRGSEALTEVL